MQHCVRSSSRSEANPSISQYGVCVCVRVCVVTTPTHTQDYKEMHGDICIHIRRTQNTYIYCVFTSLTKT